MLRLISMNGRVSLKILKSSKIFNNFCIQIGNSFENSASFSQNNFTYIQGQSPVANVREYFYYIDHQGMLFLDDSKMKNFTSCFKEKKFLQFFFKRIRLNQTGKYEAYFPYVSPCGREQNFVRCDDVPIVFTHIIESENDSSDEYLSYAHAGELLKVKFEPEKLCMLPKSGRVYHPGPDAVGGVGLVKSSLAITLSQHFIYERDNTDEMPVSFKWKTRTFQLTNELINKLNALSNQPFTS